MVECCLHSSIGRAMIWISTKLVFIHYNDLGFTADGSLHFDDMKLGLVAIQYVADFHPCLGKA